MRSQETDTDYKQRDKTISTNTDMKKYENTTDTENKTTDTNMRYKLEAKFKKLIN